VQELRRVAYVGMTRAAEYLVITYIEETDQPSCFLPEAMMEGDTVMSGGHSYVRRQHWTTVNPRPQLLSGTSHDRGKNSSLGQQNQTAADPRPAA
jgi:ATP-dependent exoDNAse (exonuclease V) beta subunit